MLWSRLRVLAARQRNTTAQIVYVYAVFCGIRIQNVMFIEKVERREDSIKNLWMGEVGLSGKYHNHIAPYLIGD